LTTLQVDEPHASPRAVGIAFAMCLSAGLCTVLGGALVYCVKATNHRFLSASLGLAAGVMVVSRRRRGRDRALSSRGPTVRPHRAAARGASRVGRAHTLPVCCCKKPQPISAQYISFVEIFSVKAVGAFEEAGLVGEAAQRFATFGFFGGVLLTWLLDKAADKLVDLAEALQRRKVKVGGLLTTAAVARPSRRVLLGPRTGKQHAQKGGPCARLHASAG
jgi:hypothetical protein